MAQPIQTEFTSHLIESVPLESEEMLRSLPNGGKGSSVTSGVSSQAGAIIPDVPSTGYASSNGDASESYSSILGGLSKLLSKTDGSARDAELASAVAKLKELVTDVTTSKLLNDQEAKRSALAKKIETIEEAQRDEEQARADSAKAKKSTLWANISGLITSVAVIAGALAATLVTGGLAAPAAAAMIASSALGAVANVNGLVVASGKDGMGETAEKAIMITSMVIGAVSFAGAAKSIAVSAKSAAVRFMPNAVTAQAGSMMSKAGAQAASLMPNSVSQAANMMSRAAAEAANMMSRASAQLPNSLQKILSGSQVPKAGEGSRMAEYVIKGGAAAEFVGTTTEASGTMHAQAYDIKAAKHSLDAQYLRADSKEIEGVMLMIDEIIDTLLDMISKENERFNSMIAEFTDSINDRGNTLAKVKFSG